MNDFEFTKKCLKIEEMIGQDPALIPEVLKLCADHMDAFKEQAKRQNDALLREALGDACHLLGMKRKPGGKQFARHCVRIIKAIFPKGITDYHHEGEKNFYRNKIEPYND